MRVLKRKKEVPRAGQSETLDEDKGSTGEDTYRHAWGAT